MSFYICHCGNTENPHNFRHAFTKTAMVGRDLDETENEYYTINCDHFKEQKFISCMRENCKASQKIHETELVPHKFEPMEQTFREINFTIPLDSICRSPNCTVLSEHDKATHHFNIKIEIVNKRENDRFNFIHPVDEDFPLTLNLVHKVIL